MSEGTNVPWYRRPPAVAAGPSPPQDLCHTPFLYPELPVEVVEQDLGAARRSRRKRKV